MSDKPNPLALVSMRELTDELERRCQGIVMAYASHDEQGGAWTVLSRGTTVTQLGLGRLLESHLEFAAATKLKNATPPDVA